MTERPILFSAPMVRAILDGKKTQTRRAVKPQPTAKNFCPTTGTLIRPQHRMTPDLLIEWESPFGQPGDRLWVRETFSEFDTLNGMVCWYKAESDDPDYWHNVTWRPSIHMPRRLSRITLEITGIRVERLQEISEADAIAEGLYQETMPGTAAALWRYAPGSDWYSHPVQCYRALWEYINGPGSWDVNPWVWVIEFKRVKP
jgi:hypothetical protein